MNDDPIKTEAKGMALHESRNKSFEAAKHNDGYLSPTEKAAILSKITKDVQQAGLSAADAQNTAYYYSVIKAEIKTRGWMH